MPNPKTILDVSLDATADPTNLVDRRTRHDPPRNGIERRQTVISVVQGETRMSDDPNAVMKTILGSCIAVCMWDPVQRVGGMNHFLMPGDSTDSKSAMRFGVNAMELLVNELIKEGACRAHLKAKLFGGAKMFAGGKDIGRLNAECAEWFLDAEQIDVVGRCVGGQQGRGIRFWPVGGRAQRRFLGEVRSVPEIPKAPETEQMHAEKPAAGDVQLF